MAVDRNYILEKMKGRMMSAEEFDFERLQAPPLYSLLSYQDIEQLRKLATSIRYAGKPIERMQMIDRILTNRGFRKLTGGTNRVVYKFLESDDFVIKVATDAVGCADNPREFINQQYYKPFVTKVFEVSPCGTVGVFERVIPITSREEFLSVAPFVYDVILNWFVGEYVCDDIGTEYFMNWGTRKGFGVVLLDFPYSYKLDGNRLYCNRPDETQPNGICGGVIDYDAGFNHLRCSKCGAGYKALELKKAIETNTIIQKGGKTKMKVGFLRGEETVVETNTEKYLDTAPKLTSNRKKGKPVKTGTLTAVAYADGKKVVNATKQNNEDNKPKVTARAIKTESTEETVPDQTVTTNQTAEKAVESPLDELKYIMFGVDIGNTAEIDGKEDQKTKVLILKDLSTGKPVRFDFNNNGKPLPLVIPTIGDKLLSELSIVPKDAQVALECKIDDLDKANKDLNKENRSLKKEVKELESQLELLQSEYDKLLNEGNDDNEDDGLPYFIDSKGKKRDKVTKKFYKEPEKKQESEFDTSSPLIKPEEPDNGDEIPVGAAPPNNNKTKASKRSARFDPEFYNRGNTSGKGNKK